MITNNVRLLNLFLFYFGHHNNGQLIYTKVNPSNITDD